MNSLSREKTIEKIASIIHNQPLATALYKSISSALKSPIVCMNDQNNVWDIFKKSLDTAIRNINDHPRGKLFRRLIEYGPHHPDTPKSLTSDDLTTLSDPECGQCVQFIFSHMVNRFKGELAELLSIEPCLELIHQLQNEAILPKNIKLYLGDTIQEKRRNKMNDENSNIQWGSFTKGADGLIVENWTPSKRRSKQKLDIFGVIEVKSMHLSANRILAQINKHISRLKGGLKLSETIWPPDLVRLSRTLCFIVVPSTWKLSRKWHSVKTIHGRKIMLTEPTEPPLPNKNTNTRTDVWKIKLAWSQEALEQAAYEMTFWYMSQVGKHIYTKKSLPKGWEKMIPEEAGYNAIKMMLYYIPLRKISKRQVRLAIKLYNVYSFGYPLGVDSKEMLWPEDFPNHFPGKNRRYKLPEIGEE